MLTSFYMAPLTPRREWGRAAAGIFRQSAQGFAAENAMTNLEHDPTPKQWAMFSHQNVCISGRLPQPLADAWRPGHRGEGPATSTP
jgi:hypothetical protein